jgi:hypothetical protein
LTVPWTSRCWRVHPRNQEQVAEGSHSVTPGAANAVTVNDVLDGRKLLEIDCVDRVYLTSSVPNLLVGGQALACSSLS